MVGGERGRDGRERKGEEMEGRRGEEVKGRRGGKGEGWRGDGVVWSGIGRGAKLTHLSSNVAYVCSCLSSPVSAHACRRPCPFMGAGRRSWCVVTVLAGGGSHASSCVGDGEGCGWASPLVRSGLIVVVVACVPSWVLGISCGRWWLVVVVLGWVGVRFRAVVIIFMGGPRRHGRTTRWGVCWLVTWLATSLSLSLVVVVSRW